MKKIAHLLFGRFTIIAFAILIQVAWAVGILVLFSNRYSIVMMVVRILADILVLIIVNRWVNPANKLSWTFLIMVSPIFGLVVYLLFGRSKLTKKTARRMDAANKEIQKYISPNENEEKALQKLDYGVYNQSKYINDWAKFPVYRNTSTQYYKCGEEMFPDMLLALKNAKYFIFLEYFIVEEGYMFGEIEKILEQKVKEGVDVRLIYDDVGCIGTLSPNLLPQITGDGHQMCSV